MRKLQDYLEKEITPEVIELLRLYIVKSQSGKEYMEKIDSLMILMQKIVGTLSNYPYFAEIFITSVNNGNMHVDEGDFGIFNEKEYIEIIRTNMITEDDHAGRYMISWLLLSLSSLSDQFIEKLATEYRINFNNQQKNWNVKRKIRFILNELDLWEEFKKDKEDFLGAVESVFDQLYSKRNLVAHKELTPQWAKELIDRNFKEAVNKNLKIQKYIMESWEITTEENKEVMHSLLEFNSTIEIITRVFTSYFGFLDNFIDRQFE